jgi:hypothetical protein
VHGSLAVLGETAGQKGGRKGKLGRVAKRAQFANEHQVLVVAHRDTPEKPHVHIVVNRVHPGHGVMLPTSNDYLKLSKWAEQFEREHGGLVVDARAIANAARDQGEKVYGKKRPPRDVYEAEKDARDNHPEALKIQTEQRTKDAALAKQSEATRTRCLVEWRALEATHKQRLADLNEETEKAINTDKWTIRGTFQGQKAMLMAQQRIETKAFEKAEESLIGRANNALRSLISLSGPVNVLWSQGARIEAFQRAQERKTLELEQAERRQKKEAETRIRSQVPTKRVLLGQKFQIERQELILRHQMEKAALRAAWKTRQAERTRVWDDHRQRMEQRPPEQSFGRQTTVADERTREMVKSAQELMKYQQRKAKEPRDHGRGGR